MSDKLMHVDDPKDLEMNYHFTNFAKILTPMDIINAPMLLGDIFLTIVQMISTTLTLQLEDRKQSDKGRAAN